MMTGMTMVYQNNYINVSRDQLLKQVEEALSQKRFDHVLRVEETALELAKQYQVDEEKVSIAALLHDYAKEMPSAFMKDQIINENMDLDMLDYDNNIWHGPVASILARKQFDVSDKEILNAIYYHTFGHTQMSDVEKVIFIADYIEPSRQFKAANKARKKAQKSLDNTLAYIVRKTLVHLIDNQNKIYPKALETYNGVMETQE